MARKERNWGAKGDALLVKGKCSDAIKAYDNAIKMNPQSSETWYKKGFALSILGELDDAVKAFDKAIEINPQYTNAWINKGNVFSVIMSLICWTGNGNNRSSQKPRERD